MLISQQATATVPEPATLADAFLWNYTFTYYPEDDLPLAVAFNDVPPEPVTPASEGVVVCERLDIREIHTARGWMGEQSFSRPVTPSLDHHTRIEVDDFRTLFAQLPRLQLQIEVRHEFAGMRTPVLLVARQDFSEELIEPIESAIRQWLDAAQPPTENARLSLDVTCSIADTPLLRLRDVSLPL
jgi:hypothetical protein